MTTQLNKMKTLYSVLFVFLFSAFCFTASAYTPPAVKDFHGIASGGPIEVMVTIGNTEGIKFEGDADAIATLIAEVKSGILIIRPKNSWKSWAKTYENKKIVAHVNAKSISSLTISGDGSMKVKGVVTATALTTTLSGSGSLTANIDADQLTTVISGSGQLNLSGKTGKVNATLSGSCNFDGKSLSTENLSAKISGSGKITIQANNSIKATILGSGKILYSGNPTIEKTLIGSGEVSEI